MQTKKKLSKATWVSIAVILILILATLVLSHYFGDRKYYISSLLIILFSMIPFFVGFESRKPQARELVTIAVLCAIAVASRAAFIMLPSFKPIVGIIIISGMAFGARAGFLTGAISAFVSNFIFGQGPWTPWQMFAFGIAGFLAGLLHEKGILKCEKKLQVTIFGGIVVILIVGPLLDTCTLFTMASMVDTTSAAAVYLAGLPFNAVHAVAVMLTLFLLTKPMMEKLTRIKIKYGMMEAEEKQEVVWTDQEVDAPVEPEASVSDVNPKEAAESEERHEI